MVGEDSSVVLEKIQQMRHLFQVRRHVVVVTSKMGIVELDINHVFDPPLAEFSGQPEACAGDGRKRQKAAINSRLKKVKA